MIKPWLILTKNWFRSRIGWNVTKWSRCLHIEQFCISQLLVSNWKSSTCIWLQLIDYIANEIISVIGDWISRIGCFLVAHCSIKFHFKYWNILQCHLITITFYDYKNSRVLYKTITQSVSQIVTQIVTQTVTKSLPKSILKSLPKLLPKFLNRSWKQISD